MENTHQHVTGGYFWEKVMKTRFNLLIPVVGAKGYRLARVDLQTSDLTEQDKELALEHFFLKAIQKDLSMPLESWEEGEFIHLNAKDYIPQEVTESTKENVMDSVTFEELKAKLEEKEQEKQFLSNLSNSMKGKAKILLKTYSLQEVREVFRELRAKN